jgi:hypothetical protein
MVRGATSTYHGSRPAGVISLCEENQKISDIVSFFWTASLEPFSSMEIHEFVKSQQICNASLEYENLYHDKVKILEGLELFLTDKGWLGLVLEDVVDEGDEIWIVFGCSMPMLIRPYEGYDNVVAPVAVPGIMKEEGVKGIGHFNYEGKRCGE